MKNFQDLLDRFEDRRKASRLVATNAALESLTGKGADKKENEATAISWAREEGVWKEAISMLREAIMLAKEEERQKIFKEQEVKLAKHFGDGEE